MKAFPAHQAQPGPGEEALVPSSTRPPPSPTPHPGSPGEVTQASAVPATWGPIAQTPRVGKCLGQRLPGPQPPAASHLLEFLGFDLHLLLQGRVGAPELHGLLVTEHHLLLHFPLTAFLGQGRAQGLSGAACTREGQGSSGDKLMLPVTGSGSTAATEAGKERAAHGPQPPLLPVVSRASPNLLLSSYGRVFANTAPPGMETPARTAGAF